jgi:ADP-heptose:LPS heptosyltransferase
MHRQDYYLNIFEKSGIEIKDKLPQIFFDEKNKVKSENLLGSGGNKAWYAGMNPSANWFLKRWPAKNFALLADRLISELDCAVFFIGAPKEKDVVADTLALMKQAGHDLCGRTNLGELSALMNNLDVFISNDSGPAHMSAALGTPTIALFGPTDAKQTCPRGRFVWIIKSKVDCTIPCYNSDCRKNVCMENITVDEVFNRVKLILTVSKENA